LLTYSLLTPGPTDPKRNSHDQTHTRDSRPPSQPGHCRGGRQPGVGRSLPGGHHRRGGARAVARGARGRGRVRHSRRGDPAGVRPALRLEGAAHPGPARAGRRARRDRVRAGHRQGRRVHRDQRSGRDEPGDADRRRLHGLGSDRRDHRPGGPALDRYRRLPGGGHPGHHAADHQAQLPGADRRRDPADRRRGVPPGGHRPARPGPGRRAEGRAPGAHHVHLAAHPGPARLPPDAAPARQADP
jgi:hypothetical protein